MQRTIPIVASRYSDESVEIGPAVVMPLVDMLPHDHWART